MYIVQNKTELNFRYNNRTTKEGHVELQYYYDMSREGSGNVYEAG
jgi:hypothetical protein